jgi:hypothetical protein
VIRVALAVLLAAAAVVAALGALDARAWDRTLARDDATFADTPLRARWDAGTRLPGDPARAALALDDDLALRRAVRSFLALDAVPRGIDNGELRGRARAVAQIALADVASNGSPEQSSQANDLLGVIAAGGGRVAGVTAAERARAAFEAAVRADPSNVAAKYNLELVVRRMRARGVREEPGKGSGPGSRGRRGAGAGTPGRGY